MKQLMEYKIISGRTVEIRRVYMTPPKKRPARRGLRVKKSSLKKISANERDAVMRVSRLINCNFTRGDLFATLTYADAPESVEEGKRRMEKFLRKMKREYEKRTGKKLQYIVCTSAKSSETGERVRVHHHCVLPADAEELLYECWSADDVTIRKLDGKGDYTALGRYLILNSDTGEDGGQRRYTCSKGLKQPVYTEPVPVNMSDRVRVPSDAAVREQVLIQSEDQPESAGMYVRYVRAREPNGRYRDLKILGR